MYGIILSRFTRRWLHTLLMYFNIPFWYSTNTVSESTPVMFSNMRAFARFNWSKLWYHYCSLTRAGRSTHVVYPRLCRVLYSPLVFFAQWKYRFLLFVWNLIKQISKQDYPWCIVHSTSTMMYCSWHLNIVVKTKSTGLQQRIYVEVIAILCTFTSLEVVAGTSLDLVCLSHDDQVHGSYHSPASNSPTCPYWHLQPFSSFYWRVVSAV